MFIIFHSIFSIIGALINLVIDCIPLILIVIFCALVGRFLWWLGMHTGFFL